MSRVERIGDATLYLGDCREILPTLGCVDAVVTDPPYGIAYKHSGNVRGVKAAVCMTFAANRRGSNAVIGDDRPFDPGFMLNFSQVLMWGADRYHHRLPDGGSFLSWDKTLDRGPADSFVDVEFAWCNWRERRNGFSMLWKGLACDKRGENQGLREHTTQKPIRLMEWCVQKVTGNVLDPFMGSGTTGVACAKLGRSFIGIEIHEPYFDIACRRIEEAYRQPDMFVSALKKRVDTADLFSGVRI